ncbi:MAG: hypothetical protein PVI71_06605 [Desulfobacterales bacterium]|jgi:hypothetical protein
MNIKRSWLLLLSAVLLTATPLMDRGLADDRARERKTLKGIQAVIVKVHSVEAKWRTELKNVGLSESVLQASIEHQLHKAGIQVIAEEASSQSEFEGILNVRLKFNDPEPAKKRFLSLDENQEEIEKVDTKKKYLYAIRLNLRQLVSLQRDPSAKAFSITWQTESSGLKRLTYIKEDIKNLVDVFIQAYTSENPNSKKR